ncbi:MAG: UDP-N-acetylmuramyl-tripeptide synthetase [Patescibacteria group bacterium]|nr:UDP-N-acetylmuramyl-tripeptide synthetase [Patescibacteria group bacterium]
MYGFPGLFSSAQIIGVTGTNGKSTTSSLTAFLYEKAGYKVAMASTVSFQIGDRKWKNKTHKTTEGRLALFSFLSQARKEKCDIVILEVSSHAIDQYRIWGISFDAVVCTNLTPEHLDYHKTMEHYAMTKSFLFSQKKTKHRFLPQSFEYASYFQKSTHVSKDIEYISLQDYSSDFVFQNIQRREKVSADLFYKNTFVSQVETSLVGDFNLENILFSIALFSSFASGWKDNLSVLAEFHPVPGRMELVYPVSEKIPSVYIDYAVTPESFDLLYKELRKKTRGALWAVFGSCGDRDKIKRPFMGLKAVELCDYVIVTNEEPYTENRDTIIDQVFLGTSDDFAKEHQTERLCVDPVRFFDRGDAISYAIENAQPEDIIVVSGMGDQDTMIVGSQKIEWSDRTVISNLLQKRLSL